MSTPPKRRGRPPKKQGTKREKVTLTWPPPLIEQAFAYADARGISLSDLAENAVKAELERLDDISLGNDNKCSPSTPVLSALKSPLREVRRLKSKS